MNTSYGFTLLEVLVSLFLLSLVLLGLFAADIASLRQVRGILYFQQAINLTKNMGVYLRAHHGDSASYRDVWSGHVRSVLPNGSGQVTGAYPDYKISIKWGDIHEVCTQNKSGISGCAIINTSI